ncbi:MAG TPA: dihydroorotate dehydrogenase [Candidatus Avimonas sp.]|jgi:dihydroorotate dehydrogenase (NAD+) catalytic subunit|nr:dihydroorotate dehydrogenase [Clostridiales bacterium]HOB36443.1 dihydroorotate dehydrogenase [Candidatus Avimonas sp.]HQA15783.1 dihydroorotate dehydrogenase [Candidatus Avimonas sp.]HQD37911.1 dihydroorotate dehydrogenase [Candidatus Avimonas sp.]
MSDMSVTICGVTLKNPVIAASGTFGYGMEYNEFYPISRLGGVSCKGTTLKERLGNPPPRIAETCAGILNSVGLQNPGLDSFISTYLPWLKKQDTAVIANIAGSTVEEYCEIAERLSGTDVDIIELNISCPNVKQGGVSFGTSCESVAKVTSEVKKRSAKPVMVKLTPNVTDIGDIAKAAEDAGADALSLINTITGMRIDIKTRRPVLRNNTGGLSGPAVFPVAVRMVHEVYKRVNIPVVGMGGITKWEDAAEMMIAGASAVQVGTANFRDPFACIRIIEGLERFAASLGLKSIAELTGTVLEW